MLHQPLDLPARSHEDQLVGIGRAQIDAVRVLQFVPLHLRAVDKGSVPAFQIFDPVFAVLESDRCVLARGPVVAHHQLRVSLPPDAEGECLQDHRRAMPSTDPRPTSVACFQTDREACFSLPALRPNAAPSKPPCGCSRASSISLARNTWQCER